MQTEPEPIAVDQELWESAAEAFSEATKSRVVIPTPDCECLGCHVARLYLLPFLPVTWH